MPVLRKTEERRFGDRMLNRNSERWDKLTGLSGKPDRRIIDAIYALQEEAYIEENEGDKFGFWEVFNQLCHQGTIYPVTYAAVPHLLPAIRGETLIPRIEALLLLSEINLSYRSTDISPPDIPPDLQGPFEDALKTAKDLALRNLNQLGLAENDLIFCLMATAGLHNLPDVSQTTDQAFIGQGLIGKCEDCSAQIEILCKSLPFTVQFVEPHPKYPERAFGTPTGPLSYVSAKPLLTTGWNWKIELENAPIWMAHFAIFADQAETKERLTFLFGEYACPICSKAQSPWAACLTEKRA